MREDVMSVTEFFDYLFVHEPSRQLAVRLADAYAAREVVGRASAARAQAVASR
jgi:hypothetical protein